MGARTAVLDVDALTAAYLSGMTLRELGKLSGAGTSTVWRRLKAKRVELRKPGHGNIGRKAA